jgi:membrane fusion protein, copper/silver efflux system
MKSLYRLIKQNWKVLLVIFAIAFLIGYIARGCSKENLNHSAKVSQKDVVWTCSMHPQIRQPDPGKCPICAMDLIPLENNDSNEDLAPTQLKLSSAAIQLAEIQTSLVEKKTVGREISLFGKVEVDETRYKSITSWIPGRIEKLFVDYTGANVKKENPLVEIYSPELFVAQQEYLDALNGENQFFDISQIRKKLELLGLNEDQIAKVENRGSASEYMIIRAPIGGVVIKKSVQQGQYVKTGSPLYDIADLASIWIYLDAYEKDIAFLSPGQKVIFKAEAYPGETFNGKVDFIEPVLNRNSRTVKVRVTAQNKNGRLKPGLFVNAKINTSGKDKRLLIPASAPLQTGQRSVVYVAVGKGKFEGRQVVLGPRVGDYYEVRDGLTEGEFVVSNGNFKIDSEMQIRAKKSMMNPTGEAIKVGHEHHGQSALPTEIGDHKNHSAPSQMNMQSKVGHNQSDVSLEKMAGTPKSFLAQLDDVYRLYFKVQKAFSHDKLDEARDPSKELADHISKVKGELGNHQSHFDMLVNKTGNAAKNISNAKNFAIARSEFQKLSDSLLEITTVFGTSGNVTIKQFNCPMAFSNNGANWMQNFDDVENPYYGAEMFSCGSLEKTFVDLKGGNK